MNHLPSVTTHWSLDHKSVALSNVPLCHCQLIWMLWNNWVDCLSWMRYAVGHLILLALGVQFLPCCSCNICPSVRPSVCQTRGFVYRTNLCRHSYTIWKVNSSSLPTRRMVGRGRPFVPEIFGQTDPNASKMAISNRYSLVAPQRLDLAKKVQLSLIGSPIRAFQWA